MPRQANALASPLAPALIGHGFQQAALVGMLPLLAQQLALDPARIATAVGLGLLVSASLSPVLAGALGARGRVAALLGLVVCAAALALLLIAPPPPGRALAALLAIRVAQGAAAALLLAEAQAASASAPAPLSALAGVQRAPAVGRAAGAALIGPLAALSPAAPIAPAALGALLSLRRARGATPVRSARLTRPWPRALTTPLLAQTALGAAQIGLGPRLQQALELSPTAASGAAGLCLAAAHLGLLGAHLWLTPRAFAARWAAPAMAVSSLGVALVANLPAMIALAAILSGAVGVALARNLHAVMAARPAQRAGAALWNGAAQLWGVGLGVTLGGALLDFGGAAPFCACAALSVLLIFRPNIESPRS